LYVYAINYNILTIENGNFTLEWATWLYTKSLLLYITQYYTICNIGHLH
jgi:hypothetical protein